MPTMQLPFSTEKREVPRLLPDLQEQANSFPHLLEYLGMLPLDKIGIPRYLPELSRQLIGTGMPNVIYPVKDKEGEERIFIHVYPDPEDIRSFYIAIEPTIGMEDLEKLLAEIEARLVDFGGELSTAETEEEKKQVLLKCVDSICDTEGRKSRWFRGGKNPIQVTPRQLAGLKYLILRDKVGMGILEPMLRDPYIEDISCSGLGQIFIEHKIFRGLKTAVSFTESGDLDDFVLRLSQRVKKPATAREPIVDSVLPAEGSPRINIVYGDGISKRGSNFTIRKFAEIPYSILQLIELGTLDYTMAAYLSLVVEMGMSVFVIGETASGKTTTLNALTTFIPSEAKIVSIEDTPELQVPQKNWVREVAQTSTLEQGGAQVSMFDLLRASLRQRPNIIIVGEIRGAEGAIAFQAMQTGHAVMATFHASSVERLVQRLTGNPINIPKSYIDNLNLAVVQSQVRLPNGIIGRRIMSINEIIGYDALTNSFSYIEAFRWDPLRDTFDFVGNTVSYLLEERVALRLGFPPEEKRRVYEELRKRAKVLKEIHRERGVRNFYELLQVLAKLQKEGEF